MAARDEKLEQPLHWKRPLKIHQFHERLVPRRNPSRLIAHVGDIMRRADWHVFQVLTKRDGRMRELLSGELRWTADLQNVACGVNVEDRPEVQALRARNCR